NFSPAFTLIELVVVTFTIGMLSLLLWPALAKSKSDVSRVVCSNNLRQLGIAASLYPLENRNYLAFANWDGGGTFGSHGILAGVALYSHERTWGTRWNPGPRPRRRV